MATPAEDNTRRHREQMHAYNRHDADAMAQTYASHGVLTDHALEQTFTGRDAVRAYVQANFDAFSDDRVEQVEIIATGDWTVARFVGVGTHDGPWGGLEPTGLPTTVSVCSLVRWEDGKAVEDHLYYDLYGVLAQLGQVPALAATA